MERMGKVAKGRPLKKKKKKSQSIFFKNQKKLRIGA